MVLPRRLVPTLPSLRHRRVRMKTAASEGERVGQRSLKGNRDGDREKRNKGKREAATGKMGENECEKEREKERQERNGGPSTVRGIDLQCLLRSIATPITTEPSARLALPSLHNYLSFSPRLSFLLASRSLARFPAVLRHSR
ncbi:hypothetical protein PUN28_006229 [Cardiocondyla obscurior]|uniref:Uncharacterized protein n=1 Tax=Cardiocondyla obscurior TaxID=286306 RepID=A0AAW2GAI5_9HYME